MSGESTTGGAAPSRAAEGYAIAAKRFVNRDAAGALEALDDVLCGPPPAAETLGRAWMLYAALCEWAARDGEHDCQGVPRARRRQLAGELRSGTLWERVAGAYAGSANIPVAVALSISRAMERHAARPAPTIAVVEVVLARWSAERRSRPAVGELDEVEALVRHFVLRVLPRAGELEYAREVAANAATLDPAARDSLEADLARLEQARAEENMEEAARQHELAYREQQRTAEAIALASAGADAGGFGHKKDGVLDSGEALVRHDVAVDTRMRPPTPREYLRRWLRGALTGYGLYNTLLLVACIAAALSSRRLRRALVHAGRWLWSSAAQSARMGLTVTYL